VEIERRILDGLLEDNERLMIQCRGLLEERRRLEARIAEFNRQVGTRLEGVDWAKGAAILLITLFHCYEAIYGWPGHDLFGYLRWGLLRAYTVNASSWESTVRGLLKLTGLGYQGVHVFVILSGFLQMWTSRDRKRDAYEYYVRRFLRLYPLYWLAILGVVALNLVIHGNLGATPIQVFGAFLGYAPLLSLNPSFWFMMLIVQLYLLFPILREVLGTVKEREFLAGTGAVTVLFLFLLADRMPWAGFFAGCWLFEFSLGMVMANHRSRVESLLRGIRSIILLLLAYLLGLGLSSFPQTWALGRPLYGAALTLLLWSIYNTVRGMGGFGGLNGMLVFIGRNSFAMFLINQPFIQEYYLLLGNRDLVFMNPIIGNPRNFGTLSISRYLMVELSYVILVIFLSYLLTEVERRIAERVSSWGWKRVPGESALKKGEHSTFPMVGSV